MSGRLPCDRRLLALALAALAGCAEVPTQPAPAPLFAPKPSAQDERVRQAVARHTQLAREYRQSGDLASAAVQWQLVTLLVPADAAARQELAATRAEIARRVQENLASGSAALRAGDTDKAAEAMLRAMALDPENAEAAKQLREIERRRAAKTQSARAARANAAGGTAMAAAPPNGGNGTQRAAAAAAPAASAASAKAPAASTASAKAPAAPVASPADVYDYEQPLEMLKAGDTAGGLRDLRRYVDANPGDKAARNRIGNAVYDRAVELESRGSREQAFALYEQAVALRGEPGLGWNLRIQALRKSLSEEYYEKGALAAKSNPGQAIKDWETSLRYDPQNTKSAARLKEARAGQTRSTAGKS